jgi:hypothetical protein
VAKVVDILKAMRSGSEIRFADACKVAEYYFGPPRNQGTSHRVYAMPWAGDPRVNLQNDKGKAKRYQVRQLLAAIDKKENPDA